MLCPKLLLRFLSLMMMLLPWIVSGQQIGETEQGIRDRFGEPNLTRTAGDRTIWMYPDGTKLVFVEGAVTEFTPGSRPAGAYTPTAESRPATQRSLERTPTERRTRYSRHTADRDAEPQLTGGAVFLFIVGGLVILVCNLLFIVAAFSESVLWGLGVLLVPFVSVIFLLQHWESVKKPFLVSLLVGLPLMVLGAIVQAGAGS